MTLSASPSPPCPPHIPSHPLSNSLPNTLINLSSPLPLPADPSLSSSSIQLPLARRGTKRPITRCDSCRRRKCQCDRLKPSCSTCKKAGKTCVYSESIDPNPSVFQSTQSSRHSQINLVASSNLKVERLNLIHKLDHLKALLAEASAIQSLHSRQPVIPAANFGIDLEADNLITHFSKLWLRKEPDDSFFRATHPAVVKLRQDQIPLWRQSERWATWADYQSPSRKQLTRFDPSLLPSEIECRELCRRFLLSCDWYFELLTENEMNVAEAEVHHYRSLGLFPSSSEQWTRIALALAVCRLTLACLGWAGADETDQPCRKRREQILNWCDLSVMALQRANFDQNPTVEAMRVLIILLSTIFFETDYGLMGSSPQMLKLRQVAIDVSERLNLHRDPGRRDISSKEKDDRRRMWWSLVTIDSHFSATGASADGVLRLQQSDVKLPKSRQDPDLCGDEPGAPIDLRSARSRFELGKFNNRCCQLVTQRAPLATVADVWRLDCDLVALESRVPAEQRLLSHVTPSSFTQTRPIGDAHRLDDPLWNGQQIFYIGFWHIRSKLHRGLLYTRHAGSDMMRTTLNLDLHRQIVKQCSLCLLYLYRRTKLPTAFISAVASAALTFSLELIERPVEPDSQQIRDIVLECFMRLQTNSSPIIGRACQVLEHFIGRLSPHVGFTRPHHQPGSLSGIQEVDMYEASARGSPGMSSSPMRPSNAPVSVRIVTLTDTEHCVSERADGGASNGSVTRDGQAQDGSGQHEQGCEASNELGLAHMVPGVPPVDLLTSAKACATSHVSLPMNLRVPYGASGVEMGGRLGIQDDVSIGGNTRCVGPGYVVPAGLGVGSSSHNGRELRAAGMGSWQGADGGGGAQMTGWYGQPVELIGYPEQGVVNGTPSGAHSSGDVMVGQHGSLSLNGVGGVSAAGAGVYHHDHHHQVDQMREFQQVHPVHHQIHHPVHHSAHQAQYGSGYPVGMMYSSN